MILRPASSRDPQISSLGRGCPRESSCRTSIRFPAPSYPNRKPSPPVPAPVLWSPLSQVFICELSHLKKPTLRPQIPCQLSRSPGSLKCVGLTLTAPAQPLLNYLVPTSQRGLWGCFATSDVWALMVPMVLTTYTSPAGFPALSLWVHLPCATALKLCQDQCGHSPTWISQRQS